MLPGRERLEILIFLIVIFHAINTTSGNKKDDSSPSALQHNNANQENNFKSRHTDNGHHKKPKSNRHSLLKVAIGHKQYVVDRDKASKPLGRNQRFVDKPDQRDRSPFMFQTYK